MMIVSACLAGINSRYNGTSSEEEKVVQWVREGRAIPLCPEQLGGLPTPRARCEMTVDQSGKQVICSEDGRDLTRHFIQGGKKMLAVARALEAEYVILKSKSPSCGCGKIYDGTFSGTLAEGNGIAAQLLLEDGFTVYREDEIHELTQKMQW